MIVDLTPVIQASVSVAALALGTVGSWALVKLAGKLGVQKDSAAMANLSTAAMNVSTAALSKLQGTIAQKGWDHPDVKNLTLAIGATALAAKFPDTLKAVGLDPASDSIKVQSAINDVLERVFPVAVAQVAASPATPAADLTMATAPGEPAPVPPPANDLTPLLATIQALSDKVDAMTTPVAAAAVARATEALAGDAPAPPVPPIQPPAVAA